MIILQKLLSFFILYAVVYNNYASGTNKGNSQNPANPGNPGSQENPGTLASSNPHRFSHLDHCEVKCNGSNEVCNLVLDTLPWPGSTANMDSWWECRIGCSFDLASPGDGDVVIDGDVVGLPGTLEFAVNTTATYSCDLGYTLSGGTNPRNCQADGTWSGSSPSCNLVICPPLSDPTDGTVTLSDGVNFQSIATFTCDANYDLVGVCQLFCLSDGSWSDSAPICMLTTCPPLSDPTNGDLTLSDAFNVESIAEFTCDANYDLIGVSQLVCLSGGSWSESAPICTLTTCGSINAPTDGSVSYSNDLLVESIATFTCNEGHVIAGLSQLVCLSSGAWSESSPTCPIVDCGPLQAPCDGSITISSTTFDSDATFVCDDAFTLIGPATRECLADGTWSGVMPYCVPADCPVEYEETDYPMELVDVAFWRPFWWYDSTGGWPTNATDTLGVPFGCCDPAALHCFGRLPQCLVEDTAELLAKDSAGNVWRWAFDPSNPTAHGAWMAFHDHQQTAFSVIQNSAPWTPTYVSGGTVQQTQDSWMYRVENGVASFMLDDDNCDCYTTLNAGHAMCYGGFII